MRSLAQLACVIIVVCQSSTSCLAQVRAAASIIVVAANQNGARCDGSMLGLGDILDSSHTTPYVQRIDELMRPGDSVDIVGWIYTSNVGRKYLQATGFMKPEEVAGFGVSLPAKAALRAWTVAAIPGASEAWPRLSVRLCRQFDKPRR